MQNIIVVHSNIKNIFSILLVCVTSTITDGVLLRLLLAAAHALGFRFVPCLCLFMVWPSLAFTVTDEILYFTFHLIEVTRTDDGEKLKRKKATRALSTN
jgi:hypothetical protein